MKNKINFTLFISFFLFAFAFAYAKQEETIYCPQVYDPVCAELQVYCIKAPCKPVQKTFSNECMARANKNTLRILHKGACKFEPAKKPVPIGPVKIKNRMPENCKVWFDGCNICSRKSPSSPPLCTLRACIGDRVEKAYCKEYFKEKDKKAKEENKESKDPTISLPPASSSDYAQDNENMYPYDNSSIFLNIKNGDTISSPFILKGFVNLSYKGPNLWSPFERQSGSCEVKIDNEVLISFPLMLGYDWMDKALKKENLWFSKELNLPEGSYTMKCKNENPSGLPSNARAFTINFKVVSAKSQSATQNTQAGKEGKEKEAVELKIKNRYNNARIVKKEEVYTIVEVPKKLKLFGILPITIKELLKLDNNSLKVIEAKKPWWAIFAF